MRGGGGASPCEKHWRAGSRDQGIADRLLVGGGDCRGSGGRVSVFSFQFSVFGFQFSVFSFQGSGFGVQGLVVSCRSSVVSRQSSVVSGVGRGRLAPSCGASGVWSVDHDAGRAADGGSADGSRVELGSRRFSVFSFRFSVFSFQFSVFSSQFSGFGVRGSGCGTGRLPVIRVRHGFGAGVPHRLAVLRLRCVHCPLCR